MSNTQAAIHISETNRQIAADAKALAAAERAELAGERAALSGVSNTAQLAVLHELNLLLGSLQGPQDMLEAAENVSRQSFPTLPTRAFGK